MTDKWIPVADRVPERNEMVCVMCGDRVTVGTYSPSFEDWWAVLIESAGFEPTPEVTHWMPMPQPVRY
ncbi:MAG: DUF551 domain-containing protein [Caulobacteraceae bacterium]|nr:DUF551 domain-containing protein [Caulobacteraceae bacterium]